MTTRRTLLTAFGLSLASVAVSSFAQQQVKVWRIGFLQPGARPPNGLPPPLRAGFAELGYVEGKNVVYEGRWAEGKFARLPELAAELVGLRVDAIIVLGYPAAEAAKRATSTIPIVIVGAGDA